MAKDFYKVAFIIIGNEILTAKVNDMNGPLAIKYCKEFGIDIFKIATIPDNKELILSELKSLKGKVDLIITSGGVGHTHDDITIPTVAEFYNQEYALNEGFLNSIKDYFGDRFKPRYEKHAIVPKELEILWPDNMYPPIFKLHSVFMLPGIPSIFNWQSRKILELYKGKAKCLKVCTLKIGENAVASILPEIEKDFEVEIGSYPIQRENGSFFCRITFESRDPNSVEKALESFKDRIENDWIEAISDSYPGN